MMGELDSPSNPTRLLERIEESLDMDSSMFELEQTGEEWWLTGAVPSERDRNRLERFVYDQLGLHEVHLDLTVDELLQGEASRTGGDPEESGPADTPAAQDFI